MSSLTDTEKEAYELYNQGKVEEAMSKLTPGTEHYDYLKILEAIKASEESKDEEYKKLISEFKRNSDSFSQIVRLLVEREEYEFLKSLGPDKYSMNFSHSKPRYAASAQAGADKTLGSNVWKQDLAFSQEKEIHRVYNSDNAILTLSRSLLNEVDFHKLDDKRLEAFTRESETLGDIVTESFIDRLAKYYEEKYNSKDHGQHYEIAAKTLRKLTVDQLDKLKQKLPRVEKDISFRTLMFEKRYHYYFHDPEFYEFVEHKDARDLFINIRNNTDESEKALRSGLLKEILAYGVKLGIYDKDLFLEYIKEPVRSTLMFDKGPSEVQGDNWSYLWWKLQLSPEIRDEQMYRRHLEYFYSQGDDWSDFNDYFTRGFLRQFKVECAFYAGKEVPADELRLINAQAMNKKVLIDLHETNKDQFGIGERVKIITELKNVPKLYIKVFEFNTLNYYKKTMSPFQSNVNLDGLVATKEFEYDFDESPQKKFRQEFEFPHLDDQVGLFIVEFIANGFSSRAVIKKGALSLVNRSTVAGNLAFIVDENKNICCSENTGLWISNNYYPCDVEKGGRILIPFDQYCIGSKAILVHDGFAHLANFKGIMEQYEFEAATILHPESLIMGNKAPLIIKPRLYMDDGRI